MSLEVVGVVLLLLIGAMLLLVLGLTAHQQYRNHRTLQTVIAQQTAAMAEMTEVVETMRTTIMEYQKRIEEMAEEVGQLEKDVEARNAGPDEKSKSRRLWGR